VARVKGVLSRKLERILTRRFPPPDTVKLEDHEGIIGVITSAAFSGMESIDRQNLIGDILENHLTPEERRRVQVIVGVTPDEGTGYLSDEG
jgi:stress-induced morphogen